MNRVIRATKGKRDALTLEANEAQRLPQCLNFRWNEWGVAPICRSKTLREEQQFIGHCARQCQIVATTTGFVPHE